MLEVAQEAFFATLDGLEHLACLSVPTTTQQALERQLMAAKIEVLTDPTFPDVPVEVTIESGFTGSTVALLTLRHDELADLYIALTDYYADTKEN